MSLNAILVEDSPTIRDTLIPTLAELADTTVIAFAETALEAGAVLSVYRDDWDVVVVDMFLRQGSGFEVISACAKRREHQKVIVLTNYATPDIRRRCFACGVDEVFDKSTELDSFFDLCVALGASRH